MINSKDNENSLNFREIFWAGARVAIEGTMITAAYLTDNPVVGIVLTAAALLYEWGRNPNSQRTTVTKA